MGRFFGLALFLIGCSFITSCFHNNGALVEFTSAVLSKYESQGKYFVTVHTKKFKEKKVELSKENWDRVEVGETITFKVEGEKIVNISKRE